MKTMFFTQKIFLSCFGVGVGEGGSVYAPLKKTDQNSEGHFLRVHGGGSQKAGQKQVKRPTFRVKKGRGSLI